jgi:hypothetical protein
MINTYAELMDAIERLILVVTDNPTDSRGTQIKVLKAEIADFLRRQSLAVGIYADEKDREDQYYRGRPRG